MEDTRITFAIPFYGDWSYLRHSVESVLLQTSSCWKLIVCDNASPDKTVADRLASLGDGRIFYHRNSTNLGIVSNFNCCLELADTDLVTLLHHDDQLAPNYCDLMISSAMQHPQAVGLYCDATVIGADGMTTGFSMRDWMKRKLAPGRNDQIVILRGESGVRALLRGNFIFGPSMCFRASVLGDHRFCSAWGQVMDLELHVRLLMEGEEIVGLPAKAYFYRRHVNQTTEKNMDNLTFFSEQTRVYEEIQ